MNDDSMGQIEFLKHFGSMLFHDASTSYEQDKIFNLIQTDASSAQLRGSVLWWTRVKDAARYALENCTDIELDVIINEFGFYPYIFGGSKPFLTRLYDILDDALTRK